MFKYVLILTYEINCLMKLSCFAEQRPFLTKDRLNVLKIQAFPWIFFVRHFLEIRETLLKINFGIVAKILLIQDRSPVIVLGLSAERRSYCSETFHTAKSSRYFNKPLVVNLHL